MGHTLILNKTGHSCINIISVPKIPWISKDTVIAKTRLKELYNLYRQSGIQEHRDHYKAYKKEYNVIIKMAKSDYIQNIITNSNNTPKVLWKIVNRERGSSNNTLTSNIYLQDGNEID
jgi:type IV secretory pathway TrbF-like protein